MSSSLIGEHLEYFAGLPFEDYDPAVGILQCEMSWIQPEEADEDDRYVAVGE